MNAIAARHLIQWNHTDERKQFTWLKEFALSGRPAIDVVDGVEWILCPEVCIFKITLLFFYLTGSGRWPDFPSERRGLVPWIVNFHNGTTIGMFPLCSCSRPGVPNKHACDKMFLSIADVYIIIPRWIAQSLPHMSNSHPDVFELEMNNIEIVTHPAIWTSYQIRNCFWTVRPSGVGDSVKLYNVLFRFDNGQFIMGAINIHLMIFLLYSTRRTCANAFCRFVRVWMWLSVRAVLSIKTIFC